MGGLSRAASTIGRGAVIESVDRRIGEVGDIHCGLNLHLRLRSPLQMPALKGVIEAHKPRIREALLNLHYVHFAHFLPSADFSSLWVITVFDGAVERKGIPDAYEDSLRAYVTDFAATLGDVFTEILDFVEDAPRLPVQHYIPEFVDFVLKHDVPDVEPWSAYPEKTVLDIQSSRTR